MGVPRIIRRAEAVKKEDKRPSRVTPGIAKPSKKKARADKLRALAGAFTADQDAPMDVATQLDALEVKYEVHEIIGQGKEGVAVYRCTLRSSGQNFAVKRVPKPQPGQTSHSAEQPTVEALRNNSHLVSTCEVLDGANTMDYVMELHSGGDLFEWIATRGAVSEDRARAIFAGVLAGINQVHAANYIHRDLKLENILLTTPDPTAPEHVRLADFEFCTSSPALGPVGSIGYAAPETLGNLPYTTAVDVWAGGVCLYAMLAASAPFDCPESAAATARRILSAQPGMPFEEACWEHISPAAKDLVNGMLHPDPEQRMDLASAMAHPWLSGATEVQTSSLSKKPQRPKFSLRCTWHGREKRWGQGMKGPAVDGEVPTAMLMDEEDYPLVQCPLEWGPSNMTDSTPRGRANSM